MAAKGVKGKKAAETKGGCRMNGHPLPPDVLAYYEAQHYDRTESTRAECCIEAGWTIFCALVLALAFFCAQTGVFA